MDFDFGKNLKRICNAQGTSPTKVVVELGYSNSKVNMWNNGSLPKAEMLVKLAERLNCSVEEALLNATATVSLKMEAPGPIKSSRKDIEEYISEFYPDYM